VYRHGREQSRTAPRALIFYWKFNWNERLSLYISVTVNDRR
jgi:hypothetical protein